jgi:hypothetical protein
MRAMLLSGGGAKVLVKDAAATTRLARASPHGNG